jgi:acyl-CoA synthetase (AMP-forming)/AMP-acid ligase II
VHSPGALDTSDIAFLKDDWVFVLGRSDDVVIRRGQKYLAPALEQDLLHAVGVRRGRAVVVGLPESNVAVAFERDVECDRSADQIHAEIRRCLRQSSGLVPDRLIEFQRGQLPFTSSGKPIRRDVVRRVLIEYD